MKLETRGLVVEVTVDPSARAAIISRRGRLFGAHPRAAHVGLFREYGIGIRKKDGLWQSRRKVSEGVLGRLVEVMDAYVRCSMFTRIERNGVLFYNRRRFMVVEPLDFVDGEVPNGTVFLVSDRRGSWTELMDRRGDRYMVQLPTLADKLVEVT